MLQITGPLNTNEGDIHDPHSQSPEKPSHWLGHYRPEKQMMNNDRKLIFEPPVPSPMPEMPAPNHVLLTGGKVDKDEKIARAQIFINDSSEYDETFDPPLSSWQKQLRQKGKYPGDNTVRLVITTDTGEDTEAEDSWS
jgi:hypothetical protein